MSQSSGHGTSFGGKYIKKVMRAGTALIKLGIVWETKKPNRVMSHQPVGQMKRRNIKEKR